MAGNPELSRREALSGFAALSAAVAAMGTATTATAKDDTGTSDVVSLEAMAAMEFEPWERRDPPPPSAGEMGRLIEPHLTNLRIAWEMMFKKKPACLVGIAILPAELACLRELIFSGRVGNKHAAT